MASYNWPPVVGSGGGGGSPEIGLPVIGGNPNLVLFIDASGNLAQSSNLYFFNSTNYFGTSFESNTGTFLLGAVVNPLGFPIVGQGADGNDPTSNIEVAIGVFDGTNVGLGSVFAGIIGANTVNSVMGNLLIAPNAGTAQLQLNDQGATFGTSIQLQDGGSQFKYEDEISGSDAHVMVESSDAQLKYDSGNTGNTIILGIGNTGSNDYVGWNYAGQNFTLPLIEPGVSGYVLKTDGFGNLTLQAGGGGTPTIGPNQVGWGAPITGDLTSSSNFEFFDNGSGNIELFAGDTSSSYNHTFIYLNDPSQQISMGSLQNPGFSGITYTPVGTPDNDLFINSFSGNSSASYSVTIDSASTYYFLKVDGATGNFQSTDSIQNSVSLATALVFGAFENPSTPGEWILSITTPSGSWPFPATVTVTSGPNVGTTASTSAAPVLSDTFQLSGSTSAGPFAYNYFPIAGTPFNFPDVIFQFSSATGHTVGDNWMWNYTPTYGDLFAVNGGSSGDVLAGDINGVYPISALLSVNPSSATMTATVGQQFDIIDQATGSAIFNAISSNSGHSQVYMGDEVGNVNGIYIGTDLLNEVNTLRGNTQVIHSPYVSGSGDFSIDASQILHFAGLTVTDWTMSYTGSPTFSLSHISGNILAVTLGNGTNQGIAFGTNGSASLYEIDSSASNHWFNANSFNINGVANGNTLNFNDSNSTFNLNLAATGTAYAAISTPNGNVLLGDYNDILNGTSIVIDDPAQTIFITAADVINFKNPDSNTYVLNSYMTAGGVLFQFGDLPGIGSSTTFKLDDAAGNITATAGVNFFVQDIGGNNWLDVGVAAGSLVFGTQTSGNPNLILDNGSQSATWTAINSFQINDPSGNNWLNISPSLSEVIIGGAFGTNPQITLIGGTEHIIFSTVTHFRVPLVGYASDSAAGTAGLSAGDFYQTNGAGLGVFAFTGVVMVKQ
jgi:hypothetical protein